MTSVDPERPKHSLAEKIVSRSPPGWESFKLIARPISPTPSLFVAQHLSPTPRGTWGNLVRLEVGWERWRAGAQKRNISETRINKDSEKVTMEGLELELGG